MDEQTLETRVLPLTQANKIIDGKQFDLNSIRTSAELTQERLTNKELRDQWLWTNNFGMYIVEDGEAILYFGERDANPIFANLEKATTQLQNQNYVPTREGIDAVVKSVERGSTFKVKLSELPLQGNDAEWRYVEVSTAKLAEGRDTFQKAYGDKVTALFDKVHGDAIYGKKGIGAELLKKKKTTTRIYVLNANYVKTHAMEESAIARASRLGYFGGSSGFSASNRDVISRGALRGVLKTVAEGDTPQKIDYNGLSATLGRENFQPKDLAAKLDPVSACNLALTLAEYIPTVKQ